MSLSQSISAVLPSLRRYARALTGNQQAGDNLITGLLEGLISDQGKLPADVPVKVGLYRLLLEIYNRLPAPSGEAAESGSQTAADMRLSQLSPKPRQAYLLRALEGFSLEEAAYAMDVTQQELSIGYTRIGR